MANLLARADAVERRLTLLARLGMLMSFERRPNMTRRWVAVLCQPAGSPEKEVTLDTVHDAEMFAAGLESAVYGWTAIIRAIDAGTGVSIDDLIAATGTAEAEAAVLAEYQGMTPAQMTARAMDRYGEALNTLKELGD